MLKLLLISALLTVSFAEDAVAQVELDEGVLVLTEDNFDSVVNGNEFVLVEFYAPWCGHCKSLAPEYAKAATKLAEEGSSIKLGKVDATVHSNLGTKFEVQGYPTLKFFKNGRPSEYKGGRTSDTIVGWLKKKSGPPAITIAAKEDAEKLLKENVAVIGFFSDLESDDAKAYLAAADLVDDILFGICSDKDLFTEYSVEKEGVVVFKKFDDKRNDMTEELTAEAIAAFVSTSSTPLLTEFSQEAAQKLFSQKGKAFFFLAMSKTADDFEAVADATRAVAKLNADKVISIFLNVDDQASSQVLNYLDLKEGDYPTYRLINLEKNLKYKPEDSDVSEEKIGAFVGAYSSGDLKPFLKSQDVPENWDSEPVKILTGKNFQQVAFDENKAVFVEFYAPWCGHCKTLAPIWDELALKYEAVENLVIAKMDSTQNELEEVSIKGFPTLKFFPAQADGKVVDYSGDRSMADLVKFLSKHVELPKEAEKEPEAPASPEDADSKDQKKKDEL